MSNFSYAPTIYALRAITITIGFAPLAFHCLTPYTSLQAQEM